MLLMNIERILAQAALRCVQCKNRLIYSINGEKVAERTVLCHV